MKQIRQLIKEIIPVILGILIALLINDWNESRKEQKYLDQIFTSIHQELDESRKELVENIPKQQVLVDSLGKYLTDETVSIFDVIKKAGGVYGSTIKNNSWKAIANTKIELVEFSKLSSLADIDDSARFLELKREKLLDYMIANLNSTSEDNKLVLMQLSSELTSSEKNILEQVEEFIKD